MRRCRVVNHLLGMLSFRVLRWRGRILEMGGLRRRELRSYLSDIMYPPEHPTLDVRDQKRRSCTYRSIPFLVIIRLLRSLSGLNFVGIDSHVLRPIITAFWLFCGFVVVTLLSVSSPLTPLIIRPVEQLSPSYSRIIRLGLVKEIVGLTAC